MKILKCPKCKEKLDNVIEVTQEEVDYLWSLDTYGTEQIDDTESRNSWTQFFQCPICNYKGGKEIEEFIEEVTA